MGQLIDGTWEKQSLASLSEGGEFERKESSFRNWVTADGSAGSPPKAGATTSMSPTPAPGRIAR